MKPAFGAVVGDDLLGDILGVLLPVLENLAAAGPVPPAGVLPVGLAVLSVLAELCRSDSDSVLQRAA